MFNKNGNVTVRTFSEMGHSQNYETKVMSDGAVFAKIYEHDSKSGTVLFTSIAEVKYSNTKTKFSRLGMLDTLKPSGGKFEFMLEYPDNAAGKYNRWKQTNSPISEFVTETSAGDGKAAGYEAVHIDWSGSFWGGLTRQLSNADAVPTNTYISGSVGHNNWWFALGPFVKFDVGVPGPSSAIARRTVLYVRIDTLTNTKLNIFSTKSIAGTDIIEL